MAFYPAFTDTSAGTANHNRPSRLQLKSKIIALLAVMLSAHSAQAEIVEVNFSGTLSVVNNTSGIFDGLEVGDAFEGTLVYDNAGALTSGSNSRNADSGLANTQARYATAVQSFVVSERDRSRSRSALDRDSHSVTYRADRFDGAFSDAGLGGDAAQGFLNYLTSTSQENTTRVSPATLQERPRKPSTDACVGCTDEASYCSGTKNYKDDTPEREVRSPRKRLPVINRAKNEGTSI